MIDGTVSFATKISLIIQSITGILGFYGLTIPLASKDIILKQVLGLELLVQIIEFFFYLGFLYVLNIKTLTEKRYHDWFLSTPVMLFTTALYFYYVNNIETFSNKSTIDESNKKNEKYFDKPKDIISFTKKYYKPILIFVVLNFLMLLFGYLSELGYLSRNTGFILGTGALCGSFGVIYENFAKFSNKTSTFFWIMFFIWALYGVAFLLPSIPKNIGYTILDILAKNFFGIFLAYAIYSKSM
jgi:hypothetical protein